MKLYYIRYLPISCTRPGNDVKEIIVYAENEKEAYKKIPEEYSSHMARAIEEFEVS